MGGVNHQPCNRAGTNYLVISTKLSRAFTSGRMNFEEANVQLEDVILSELENRQPNPGAFLACIAALDHAGDELGTALVLLDQLEREMQEKGYEPLSSFALYAAEPSKANELGIELASAGLMKADTIEVVIHPQLGGRGFYAALPILREEIKTTKNSVATLRLMVFSSSHLADSGKIADELETNGGHNFRAAFMTTYAQWNRAYDIFLASAVWSTEMWYQTMGHGSMVREMPKQKMVG